jgi:hypothetical protein
MAMSLFEESANREWFNQGANMADKSRVSLYTCRNWKPDWTSK